MKKLAMFSLLSIIIYLQACSTTGFGIDEENGSLLWQQSGLNGQLAPLEPVLVNITPDFVFFEQRLSEEERSALSQNRPKPLPSFDYKIGPQDVLNVIVFDHPSLTNPTGQNQSAAETGRLVRSDGTIFFPYVGVVEVAGKTVEQARSLISKKLARYLESPQVDVRVAAYRSQYIYITGEINDPCVLPITDRPLPLVEAINRCGGITAQADSGRLQLTRNNETLDIDLLRLYKETAELWALYPGDKLYIPNNRQNRVFMVGEVGQQTSLNMPEGKLSLAEALADVNGLNLNTADTSGIYVIRGLPVKTKGASGIVRLQPVIYKLDASSADALIMADEFDLKPRDIVYVSASGLVRWNRALAQVLPSLQLLFQTYLLREAVID